jgi:hypothetical protein
MKRIASKKALSSLLNFEFEYDCYKNPGLIKKLVSYE